MTVAILSSSPNTGGLTAACVRAVVDGLADAGAQSHEIRLTDAGVGVCHQCDNGWGTCRDAHECQIADGFQSVHSAVGQADALAIVTPVYYGELSESMKVFIDRLRRCEGHNKEDGPLAGKWVLGVAAAGGGGGGTVTCLEQIDRFASHVGMKRFDLIGVTRWTREHQLDAIRLSARALGQSGGAAPTAP